MCEGASVMFTTTRAAPVRNPTPPGVAVLGVPAGGSTVGIVNAALRRPVPVAIW